MAMSADRQARDLQQDTQAQLESAQAELRDAQAQLQVLTTDIEGYRKREQDLKFQSRSTGEADAGLRGELDQARAELNQQIVERTRLDEQVRRHAAEKARLEDSLAQERNRSQGNQENVTKERFALQAEVEKTRNEHLRMLEEARRRADEDRKNHSTTMESEKNRLLESERAAGMLEGQVAALDAEKNLLHHRVEELESKLREAESNKGRSQQEQDALKTDVEKFKKEADTKDQTTREEVAKRVELERKLQEAEGKQPKCGCVVQ